MKQVASKEQVVKAVNAGLTLEEIKNKFGFKSLDSARWSIKNIYGTTSLERIRNGKIEPKLKSVDPLKAYLRELAKTEDIRAFAKQFINPIVDSNFKTGKHFCRIEEVWAKERLS